MIPNSKWSILFRRHLIEICSYRYHNIIWYLQCFICVFRLYLISKSTACNLHRHGTILTHTFHNAQQFRGVGEGRREMGVKMNYTLVLQHKYGSDILSQGEVRRWAKWNTDTWLVCCKVSIILLVHLSKLHHLQDVTNSTTAEQKDLI